MGRYRVKLLFDLNEWPSFYPRDIFIFAWCGLAADLSFLVIFAWCGLAADLSFLVDFYGLALNGAVARKLRKDLWKLHTRDLHKANNAAGKFDNVANPEGMNDPNIAKNAFNRWGELIKMNQDRIKEGKPPLHPLCEFLRLDPKISQLD